MANTGHCLTLIDRTQDFATSKTEMSRKNKKPIFEFGSHSFKTQAELKKFVQTEIQYKYELGKSLPSHVKEFMLALFERHPQADLKLGRIQEKTIEKITLRTTERSRHKYREFVIHYDDGTISDIGMTHVYSGKELPKIAAFRVAAREAIKDQIDDFRAAEILRNPKYTDSQAWEVHHAKLPFKSIVDLFLETHKIDLSKVEYVNIDFENGMFASQELAQSFSKFHKEKATLAMLSATENRKRGSKGDDCLTSEVKKLQ